MFPIRISKYDNDNLLILWDDNHEQKIKFANLRYLCPCAICETERIENGKSYIPIYSTEQITIKEIKIIGNYALNVVWNDNHDTGIYDFPYLRQLSG
ncbi:DUF971 domain-containing protein [Rosettibacter firmus]|uniref:DUF971 domain-containing protein n=1 Tax=Rosettibacter firmus TaxID=3111522 RepID=UPI00336BBD15